METYSRLGVLRGRLTFLWWPGAKVDVLHPFLMLRPFGSVRRKMEPSVEAVHRSWLGAMCLLECAQGGPENICLGIKAGNRWQAPQGQLWETVVGGISV